MKPAAEPADTIYFTIQELGVIFVLWVSAALSGALVPSWLFPDTTISDFVYSTLGLPGPVPASWCSGASCASGCSWDCFS